MLTVYLFPTIGNRTYAITKKFIQTRQNDKVCKSTVYAIVMNAISARTHFNGISVHLFVINNLEQTKKERKK